MNEYVLKKAERRMPSYEGRETDFAFQQRRGNG